MAARHLSFTEAASELTSRRARSVTASVGWRKSFGVALFKRLTRRLELSPLGRALARKVDLAIGEIDRSVVELAGSDDSGPLKVTMLPSVASHWLIPRLPRIRDRHPNIDVQVIADPRLLDLRAEGIDLAIRFCRVPHSGYATTRLMGDRVFPVCAPGLIKPKQEDRQRRWLRPALPFYTIRRRYRDGSDSDWRAGSIITAGPISTAAPASSSARPAC